MNFRERIKRYAISRAIRQFLKILPNVSDKNLLKLTYLAEQIDVQRRHSRGIMNIRKMFQEKHPSIQLVKRFLKMLSPNCREKFIVNFVTRALNNPKKEEFLEREGFEPPFTILISPSMKCNLHCLGCYAGRYAKEDLEFELIDRIIREAKEMGTSFFTILGGEPFLRKDMFDIYEIHNDVYFQVYTNGTLINKEIASRLAMLGNVAVMPSLDGLEARTDAYRGKGVFTKVMKAFDLLREEGVPIGYSTVVSRENAEEVASEEFVNLMISKGCFLGWYFLYMPTGKDIDVNLMPTPQQRLKLRERGLYIRNNKPLSVIDFWNDAPYVGGCIAGGRRYLHINSRGDVEPCVFAHFAVDNIKEKSLIEVLKSPFFEAIRSRQPFSENLLLPCMLIDHPNAFREVCKETRPYPTHEGAELLITDVNLHKGLDNYAREVKETYQKVWEEADKTMYAIKE